MEEEKNRSRRQTFCQAYLQTMNPQRAAQAAGCRDGFSTLEVRQVQKRLDQMRETAAAQICREDVLRQLAQLGPSALSMTRSGWLWRENRRIWNSWICPPWQSSR